MRAGLCFVLAGLVVMSACAPDLSPLGDAAAALDGNSDNGLWVRIDGPIVRAADSSFDAEVETEVETAVEGGGTIRVALDPSGRILLGPQPVSLEESEGIEDGFDQDAPVSVWDSTGRFTYSYRFEEAPHLGVAAITPRCAGAGEGRISVRMEEVDAAGGTLRQRVVTLLYLCR